MFYHRGKGSVLDVRSLSKGECAFAFQKKKKNIHRFPRPKSFDSTGYFLLHLLFPDFDASCQRTKGRISLLERKASIYTKLPKSFVLSLISQKMRRFIWNTG
uniref:Uncharacterized protein n=1 Tax=Marseillevirus sp. TaxID=2809551 RepID=A0AA96EPC3_9VIRU|nr:hypothetical protein MarDSR_235 [Marseillevirus sp.]